MSARFVCLAVVMFSCGGDDAPGAGDAPIGGIDAPGLPRNVWTWLDIPGNTCANGTPTGIGINLPPEPSDELFVYFEGGGACWDFATCFTLKSAVNIETAYDAATLAANLNGAQADRSPGNVFKNATLVWVPYCTGDLHAGIETRTYTSGPTSHEVHHVGATNTQHIVDALHAMQPSATHVWIGGSSAGGYGATLNHHRFAAAWPTLDVPVLQDSSPFVPVLAAYATWRTAWSLQYPPGCTGCDTNLTNVVDTIVAAHPDARLGLLHYDDDAVIKQYFGYGVGTGALVPATNELLANHYNHSSTKAFVIAGQNHTMFGQLGTLVGPGGVTLSSWVTQWATGDAAWATVR
ncbi:MAG: pectin acetylesterase-family hydrolase [Proteobacteria bacterium]|nr:pectin acetylesterase-family hydrolase [Pseudomonadota bacterium]